MRQNTQADFFSNPGAKLLPSCQNNPVSSPTLRAACLTAGLATAFALGADTSATAQALTDTGHEIFGLVLVENAQSSPTTVPIMNSRPISDAPAGAKGIAVLTEADVNSSSFGQTFQDLYGVDEALVLSYLVDGNTADKASYDTFLANLPENFFINSTYTSSGADVFPDHFVLFSAGQNIGSVTLPLSSYPQDTQFAGFGVALEPTATPEPGAALAMLLGGMGVVGQRLLWQRRKRAGINGR